MDDVISRQAAIDALEWTWAGKAAFDAIKNLPSAQPVTPCYLGSPCEYQNMDVKLPSAQPTQTNTPNALESLDCISRRAAIDARRYTFGNDEFSLEAAYHDCKMVFDGITDDDSFQEADTGLILYYANEIIYALQEALVKDTNVPTNDCISRQAAIDEITEYGSGNTIYMSVAELKRRIEHLPSAQPEQRWIPCSERLPQPNEEDADGFIKAYLVQDSRWMDVARWNGDCWIAWGYGTALTNVIAWMPLPEPYAERRTDG